MATLSRFIILPFLLAGISAAEIDFVHEIVPILKKHCTECHTGDKKKGGLSINTKADFLEGSENGKVVIAGNASESLFLKLMVTKDTDEQMPPKGDRVPPEAVEKIRAWINAGMPWLEGFAFKKPAYEPPLKPRTPTLPAAVAGRTHAIDRILDTDLAKRNGTLPNVSTDGTFFRRIHLDLVGLLPTPEKLKVFLADTSPDKRSKAIAALLADSQGYAEHWMSFWNDLLRNDYAGTGYIDGGRKQISKWLYQSLLDNKPYDQFVRELVSPSAESEGFTKGIKWRGEVSAGQTVPIQFAQSLGQTFLGINLKCSSCHDSFTDSWKLDQAYGLAAIFSPTPIEIHRCDVPTGRQAKAGWLFPELGDIDATKPPAERLKQLAALMTHPENGRLTRTMVNRLWHRLMGHGIVHPVDSMQTEPWNADLLDHLAVTFAEQKHDLKSMLRYICESQAYQAEAEILKEGSDAHYAYAGPRSKRLTAEQFTDAVWQITGTAPKKIDAPVSRPGLKPAAAVGPLTARWIWSNDQKAKAADSGEKATFQKTVNLPAKPSLAGAVITCDNSFKLSINGREVASGDNWETPVHVDLQASLKAGSNTITIAAVNGGSGPNLAGVIFEARLTLPSGEKQTVKTDASWQWIPSKGAAPVPATELDGQVWNAKVQPLLENGLALSLGGGGGGPMVRASLMKSDFLMRALGRPNREQIVSTRTNELTTLEAMDLNNGQILTTRLATGAESLLTTRSWQSSSELVQWLYAFAYSREPSAIETALASEALGETPTPNGLQDLLWAMLVQPEFQMVR